MIFEEWYKTLKVCELEQPLWVARAAWQAAENHYADLLNSFIEAARKQKRSPHSDFGGWGHSLFCNYQRDNGNGNGRCNCGVADMLSALERCDNL